jgi:hypothetical protein
LARTVRERPPVVAERRSRAPVRRASIDRASPYPAPIYRMAARRASPDRASRYPAPVYRPRVYRAPPPLYRTPIYQDPATGTLWTFGAGGSVRILAR